LFAPGRRPGKPWQVVLAATALAADDYLLRHKTTARARYDRALAALAPGQRSSTRSF
jgi:hypothetical protein